MNSGDYLKAAWAATARGDAVECARLCKLAKTSLQDEERTFRIRATLRLMETDFYVTKNGVAFSTKGLMGKA